MGKIARGNIGIGYLYEWGDGWLSSTLANAWDEFWSSKVGQTKGNVLVACSSSRAFGNQYYLVGLGLSVYLHPMQTSFIFETSNSAETCNLDMEIDWVAEILDELKTFYQEKYDHYINWAISWNVLKCDYSKGLNNYSYVMDFDGKEFTKRSKLIDEQGNVVNW